MTHQLSIITVLIYLCFNFADGEQKNSKCENVTTDVRQEHVVLPCTFRKGESERYNGTVRWRVGVDKNDKEALTLHSHGILTYGDKYADRVHIPLTATTDDSHWNISLVLKRPGRNDTGRYKCEMILSDEPSRYMYINLSVKDSESTCISVVVKEDEPRVVLNCNNTEEYKISYDTMSRMTWHKLESTEGGTEHICILQRQLPNGEMIYCNDKYKDRVSIGSQLSLVLSLATIDDKGNYSCTIESKCSRVTTYVYLTMASRSSSVFIQRSVENKAGLVGGVCSAVFVLVALGVIVFVLYRRRGGNTNNFQSGRTPQEVDVPLRTPASELDAAD